MNDILTHWEESILVSPAGLRRLLHSARMRSSLLRAIITVVQSQMTSYIKCAC